MNHTKKIELALHDLVEGIEARACNQKMVLSERIEQLAGETSDLVDRIKVLENEQVQMQNEITAAHRRIDELKHSFHRRIADLEKRTDDLENDGADNVRTIVSDMINDGDIRLHVD